MIFGLEQEGGSLIAPMALAHPFHPIDNRSRNRRRNLWVGCCVSSWWPLFPSRSSVLIYICIFYMSSVTGRIYKYNRSVIQYWWSCTPSHSIGLYFCVVSGSWVECHFFFSNCVLPSDDKSLIPGYSWLLVFVLNNTLDTRYLVSYNPSPPRMFLSLDLLSEYRIQHGAIGPLYVTSSYSTWIFFRGVSGFATDCPCGVWCRGLTTCLLHIGPPFGNRF